MNVILRGGFALSLLALILACSGEFGHRAGQLFPFLRKTYPELNYPPVDCEVELEEPPPSEGCVTHKLECGDTIEGTTFGAEKRLGDDFYTGTRLSAFRYDYDASGEVVYEIHVPENTEVVTTMVSPCADLDLFAFRYEEGRQECPSPKRELPETEYSQKESAVESVKFTTTTFRSKEERRKGRKFLVVVDGKGEEGSGRGQHGNYRLEVKCTQ